MSVDLLSFLASILGCTVFPIVGPVVAIVLGHRARRRGWTPGWPGPGSSSAGPA